MSTTSDRGLVSTESTSPSVVARLLAGYQGVWGICGGWALDLFVGDTSRGHSDVDVAIPRRDQYAVRRYLSQLGFEFQVAFDGQLRRWKDREFLELPLHEVWGHAATGPVPRLEILLNEMTASEFQFRRDPSRRLPLSQAILTSTVGLPILAPEIVLLYKATGQPDAIQDADFLMTLPHLSSERRFWLTGAIVRLRPNHPWLVPLGTTRMEAMLLSKPRQAGSWQADVVLPRGEGCSSSPGAASLQLLHPVAPVGGDRQRPSARDGQTPFGARLGSR